MNFLGFQVLRIIVISLWSEKFFKKKNSILATHFFCKFKTALKKKKAHQNFKNFNRLLNRQD